MYKTKRYTPKSALKNVENASAGGGGEENWYENNRIPLMYLVVLASSMSLPYFRKLNEWLPNVHPGVVALLAGTIVTVLTYGPMKFTDPKYAFSNALLLGLLVAEFVVYGAPKHFPAPVAIAFFFFMYSYGLEEAPHLWPPQYKG